MVVRLCIEVPFQKNNLLTLEHAQRHYLGHVMRLKQKAEVHVFNGHQGLWSALWLDGRLELQHCIQEQPSSLTPCALFFSPIRQQDWLIEKATELGVSDFYPMICEHSSVRRFSAQRAWKIIKEACEQSQRLCLPQLHPSISFTQALSFLHGKSFIWLDPRGSQSILIQKGFSELLLGPEGGWSRQEHMLLSALQPGTRLLPQVLRSETAALSAISWMQINQSS